MNGIRIKIAKFQRVTWYKTLKFFETLRGLDIVKYIESNELGLSENEGYRYEYTKTKYLRKAFKDLHITTIDSIIDIGSGKGCALIEFSKYPFRKNSGVEYSESLHVICKNNLKKLKIKNVDLFCMNSVDFKNFEVYNYIYFFNPFPESVFIQVLNNLISSFINSKKKINIITSVH